MADDRQMQDLIEVMKEILAEVKMLRESFDSFSSEGMPLSSVAPTNELIASALGAAALISKADPRMSGQDLASRIDAGQSIGNMLTVAHDNFQAQTRSARLEYLAERSPER